MFELIYQPDPANPFRFSEEKFESREDLKKRCQELIEDGFIAEDLMIYEKFNFIPTNSILTPNVSQ